MKTKFKGLLPVLAASLLLGSTGNYTTFAETVEEKWDYEQMEREGVHKVEVDIAGSVDGIHVGGEDRDASKSYIHTGNLSHPELTDWIDSAGDITDVTEFVGKDGSPYGYNDRGLDYLNDEFTFYIDIDGERHKEITTGLSLSPYWNDGEANYTSKYGFNIEREVFGSEIAGKTIQVSMQEKEGYLAPEISSGNGYSYGWSGEEVVITEDAFEDYYKLELDTLTKETYDKILIDLDGRDLGSSIDGQVEMEGNTIKISFTDEMFVLNEASGLYELKEEHKAYKVSYDIDGHEVNSKMSFIKDDLVIHSNEEVLKNEMLQQSYLFNHFSPRLEVTHGSIGVHKTNIPSMGTRGLWEEYYQHHNNSYGGPVFGFLGDYQGVKRLEGATFELQTLDGTVLDTQTTDKLGWAEFMNVPVGTYNVIETVAPEGYFEENRVDPDVPVKHRIVVDGNPTPEQRQAAEAGKADGVDVITETFARVIGSYSDLKTVDENNEELVVKPFTTVEVESEELPKGKENTIQDGIDGLEKIISTVVYREQEVETKEIKTVEVIQEMVEEIIEVGIGEDVYTEEEVHVNFENIPFGTEYIETNELLAGEIEVSQEGVFGILENFRVETYLNGELFDSYDSTRVIEEAQDEIILVGIREDIYTEEEIHIDFQELQYETEFIETNELFEGEYEVKREGIYGSLEHFRVATYLNGEIFSSYEDWRVVKSPENEIVLVGTKVRPPVITTEREDSKSITEEVIVKRVETEGLLLGEEKVVQEGKPRITLPYEIITFENGKEVSREKGVDVIQEGKERIIEVGTRIDITTEREDSKSITEDLVIKEIETEDLFEGRTNVIQEGKKRITLPYEIITFENGKEVSRTKHLEVVQEGEDRIIEIGTRVFLPSMDREVILKDTVTTKFTTVEVENSNLQKGERVVVQEGIDGVSNIYDTVVSEDGEEISRKEHKEIVVEMVQQIVEVGTKLNKPLTNDNSNYSLFMNMLKVSSVVLTGVAAYMILDSKRNKEEEEVQ